MPIVQYFLITLGKKKVIKDALRQHFKYSQESFRKHYTENAQSFKVCSHMKFTTTLIAGTEILGGIVPPQPP